MPSLSAALSIAVEHQRAGRWVASEELCRIILAAEPDYADAVHLLGLLALQRGDPLSALALLDRAVGLDPNNAFAHNNRGSALQALSRPVEAEAAFRRAIEVNPEVSIAHNNLANTLCGLGQTEEALGHFQQALRLCPDDFTVRVNLAEACKSLGRLAEAAAEYRQALAAGMSAPEVFAAAAEVCAELGRFDEALDLFRQAIQRKPSAEHLFALGQLHFRLLQIPEALECLVRAVQLDPQHAPALCALGNLYRAMCRYEEAQAVLEQALRVQPDRSEAHGQWAMLARDLGRYQAALDAFRRAWQLAPQEAIVHSAYLMALHYSPGVSLAELQREHAEFDRRQSVPQSASATAGRQPRPAGRLRLGIVSPNLCRHPVGQFSIGIFENLDRRACELFFYHDRAGGDDLTARFQNASARWLPTLGMRNTVLAEQIRADEVDILIDLAGHTAGNRLPLFALRPAAVQMTWIGSEGTTGLSAIDYLLADRQLVPPEFEPYYRERVLRMPDASLCYTPWPEAPPVSALPAATAGRISFASFNNPAKFTDEVLGRWAAILRRVPAARLILKYLGLDQPLSAARYRDFFSRQEIAADRVELLPFSDRADYLRTYDRVDIALDSFPFSGGATTCDALWMGVPVVTCPGQTFASRHGLSYLSAIGLTETIAGDGDEYVEMAVRLAQDLPRLAALRANLRDQMAASPLCDAPRFATNLMTILQGISR